MLQTLIDLDKEIFLALNGLHQPWLDNFMFWVSDTEIWFPLYAIFIGMMIKSFKWDAIWLLLAIALLITLTDQITSGFMKPFFGRFRPTHDPEIGHLVHTVNNYRGGTYGFASSHASNTFGLISFLWLVFKEKYHWFKWLFAWAALVAYSRIYLGVHYPGDIVVGGLIGIFLGWCIFKTYSWLLIKYGKRQGAPNTY